METFDVIIVGGGISGLFCAYTLSQYGQIKVLLIERGEYCGSKNLTGGRIYLLPIKDMAPDIWQEAPFERKVTRERISLLSNSGSLNLDFYDRRFESHSYTLLRSRFDRWLSECLKNRGIFLLTGYRVDGLIIEKDVVRGVEVGGEKIGAEVVVLSEGVLSLLSENFLSKGRKAENFALGVKEVIELGEDKINDRFNLEKEEGVAHLFFGDITAGLFGGGFLYTNRDTLSCGIVIHLKDLLRKGKVEVSELIENFKERYELKRFLEGGKTVEYAAHLIPEAGLKGLSKLYGKGFLLTGDTAGFALNMGYTVRGMEFAVASGIYAAQTILLGKKEGDFSERTLSIYEEKLKNSFVLKDFQTFKKFPLFLEDERIVRRAPYLFVELLHDLYFFGNGPKEKISSIIWRRLKESGLISLYGLKKLIELKGL